MKQFERSDEEMYCINPNLTPNFDSCTLNLNTDLVKDGYIIRMASVKLEYSLLLITHLSL